MGHRTAELPPLSGPSHILRELRYNEFLRQGLGLALVVIYGWYSEPSAFFYLVGTVVTLIGLAVRLFASGFIMKNKVLATTGPYSVVRHPLYTGNVLVLIGLCLANGTWWSWVIGGVFLWFWYPPAIEYEDRKLSRYFGESWEAWSGRTPAIIPATLAIRMDPEQGAWSFAKSMRVNAEPVVVVFVLFWLYWIARQLAGAI